MPATLQQNRCDRCSQYGLEMSIFDGICLQCFDQHYRICSDCGKLIIWNNCRHHYNVYNIGGEVYRVEGRDYCYECHHAERSASMGYWQPKPFDLSIATYQQIGSKRKFGVEIETAQCDEHYELRGQTHFGCKSDPTVSGREFDSPILYGDEGFAYISDFLSFAARKNWSVDTDCGCHTHYDMRDESDEELFRITYAYRLTYRMWRRCVPRQRGRNNYCQVPGYGLSDIRRWHRSHEDFEDIAHGIGRYDFVNIAAYMDHKTFENRLLEGTLDPNEICNWITIHCRFIDRVKSLFFEELKEVFPIVRGAPQVAPQFRGLVDLIEDSDLTDWLADRARYIGEQPLRGPGSIRGEIPERNAIQF